MSGIRDIREANSTNAVGDYQMAEQQTTYLTTEALSERIHYDVRTIRDRLKDSVLIEGVHYIRPFGGRKILYLWEPIERDMRVGKRESTDAAIPMASGALCHG
jgi:hypothetical protein